MATSADYCDFVCDCIRPFSEVCSRKMLPKIVEKRITPFPKKKK